MPYGTISDELIIVLRENGYDHAWIFEGDEPPDAIYIDTVFHGALDESFPVNDTYAVNDLVDCIANYFKTSFPNDEWEVIAYRPMQEDIYRKDSNS